MQLALITYMCNIVAESRLVQTNLAIIEGQQLHHTQLLECILNAIQKDDVACELPAGIDQLLQV